MRGILVLLAAAFTLAAAAQGKGKVDLASLRTVSGEVTSVSITAGEKHPSFVLAADTGETLTVELGAYWYLVSEGFTVAPGDQVTAEVAGCINKDETEVVAFSVENLTAGVSIVLRDSDGSPLWKGQRKGRGNGQGNGQGTALQADCYCTGQSVQPGTLQEVQGKVKKLDVGLGNHRNTVKLKAAGSGEYQVALGPFWYMQQQGFTLEKGETVRVRAIQCPDCNVALSVTKVKSGETLQLRNDEGVPLWLY